MGVREKERGVDGRKARGMMKPERGRGGLQ